MLALLSPDIVGLDIRCGTKVYATCTRIEAVCGTSKACESNARGAPVRAGGNCVGSCRVRMVHRAEAAVKIFCLICMCSCREIKSLKVSVIVLSLSMCLHALNGEGV